MRYSGMYGMTHRLALLAPALLLALLVPIGIAQAMQEESGGNDANIESSVNATEQMILVNKISVIDEKISKTNNTAMITSLENQKDALLEELFDNISHILLDELIILENAVIGQQGRAAFNIDGFHNGCNGEKQPFNIFGNIFSGQTRFWFSHHFPSALSVGTLPNCLSADWDEYLQVRVQDVFTGKGCKGNFRVSNIASDHFQCTMPIQGVVSIRITANYEGHHTLGGQKIVLVF